MAELEIKPTPRMRMRVTGVILSALFVSATLVWLLTGGGVGLFVGKVNLRTYLPDATGLGVNAQVRINGIRVGAVGRIAISGYLDKQRAVRVDFRVENGYLPKIPSDSMASIGSDTMIGDKFLDISPGKNPVVVADGGVLQSEPLDTAADKADLIYGLQDSLRKVDAMVAEVASPDTQIGRYVVGDKEYNQALRSIAVFEKELHAMVSHDNPTGDAVFTTNLYTKIKKPLHDIDEQLQTIQRGEGVAGRLYASDEQYNAIVNEMRDLRQTISQVRADMEKSGPGLRDEEMYRNVSKMLQSTDASLSALNRGEGAAGELLTSPQLYESLVGSLKGLQDVLRDFDANPKKYLRTKLF